MSQLCCKENRSKRLFLQKKKKTTTSFGQSKGKPKERTQNPQIFFEGSLVLPQPPPLRPPDFSRLRGADGQQRAGLHGLGGLIHQDPQEALGAHQLVACAGAGGDHHLEAAQPETSGGRGPSGLSGQKLLRRGYQVGRGPAKKCGEPRCMA